MNRRLQLASLSLLAGAVLSACEAPTGPTSEPDDPCVSSVGTLDVDISITADSAPMISWTPASCAVSRASVWHWVPGITCSPFLFGELCLPNSYPIWVVGTDTAGLGPALIGSPLLFGAPTPNGVTVPGTIQPPGIGDTVYVELIRLIPANQGQAYTRTVNFVIGTGLMP